MSTCSHCGRELETGAKFCNGCGAPVPEATPVATPTPVAEPTPVQATEPKENPLNGILEKVKTLPLKKIGIIGGAVVAVILVISLVLSLFAGAKEANYAVYLKDNELHINLLNGKESIEITGDFAGDYDNAMYVMSDAMNLISVTPDGKTVIYPDKYDTDSYTFTLYHRSATNEDADEEKIAANVYSYVMSKDGKRIVYLCEKGLYEYDFKDSEKIESDVRHYWTTEDCKTILYTTDDRELHKKTFGKDNDDRLEKDVYVYSVSEDLNTVIFSKDEDLYIKKGTADKEEIDSEIDGVVAAYGSGEAYYVVTEYKTVKLGDYVVDDMKDKDAAMVQPKYPSYNDFTWPKSPSSWSYSSYYWEKLDEYKDCSSYEEACELYETLYEEVYADYEAAYDAYYEAYAIWDAKGDRDYYREYMASQEIEITNHILYYFDGKESVVVTEGFVYQTDIYSYSEQDQSAVIAFMKESKGDASKIKLSEVDDVYDLSYDISEMLDAKGVPVVACGSTVTDIELDNVYKIKLSADAKNVFVFNDMAENAYVTTLNKVSVSNGAVEKIDEEVYPVVGTMANGDYCYYKFEEEGYSAEFFVNGKSIAKDVNPNTIRMANPEKGFEKFYFVSDVDDNGEGTLCYYNGSKVVEITDDVLAAISVTADGGVLYFQDYDFEDGEGELYYSENGKEGKLIDKKVTVVVSPYMYIQEY